MERLRNIIDDRLRENAGINLFYKDSLIKFDPSCIDIAGQLKQTTEEQRNELVEYTVNSVLKEFYHVNQYYHFNTESKNELKNIYTGLYENISQNNLSNRTIGELHFLNLQKWLKKTNPFAEMLYSPQKRLAGTVPCYEYSAEIQLEILRIDISELKEPILDIGCGENHILVNYFRELGLKAFGIDRYIPDVCFIEKADWLEYDYGTDRWGTIISNLGFSNHFVHHHHRADGDFTQYANTYMKILRSLKKGGSFYYAPSLPFIESYLDPNSYKISHRNIDFQELNATSIKRI